MWCLLSGRGGGGELCSIVQWSANNIPANGNRNRFTEPTSVQIRIGIVCESQNLQIEIGIIFVRWELFANYSQISEIVILSYIISIISFSWTLYIFPLKNLTGKENHSETYNAHSLYIFLIKIRYSSYFEYIRD